MFIMTGSRGVRGRKNPKTSLAALDVISKLTSFKNIAGRAGGFEVAQRGTSIAVAASVTVYTLDGWYLTSGATQASTVAQITGITDGSVNAVKVTRNSAQTGTTVMRFAMPLDTDELAKLRNKSVMLSFTVKAGANWSPASGTLNYTLYTGTGAVGKRNATGYTTEATPVTGSINLVASGVAQVVIGAISAVISAATTQAEIQFNWTPVGTAGADDSVTFDDVQLEIVPNGTIVATPVFERTDYSLDLMRCQRFAWRVGGVSAFDIIAQGYSTTTGSAALIQMPVPMRSIPTLTVTGATLFTFTDGVVNLSTSAIALDTGVSNRTDQVAVVFTTAATTAGRGNRVYTNNSTSAYLVFSSEI